MQPCKQTRSKVSEAECRKKWIVVVKAREESMSNALTAIALALITK